MRQTISSLKRRLPFSAFAYSSLLMDIFVEPPVGTKKVSSEVETSLDRNSVNQRFLDIVIPVVMGKITFEFPIRTDATFLVGVALMIAACSRPGTMAGSSALKPIDQAALQAMVDTTARELLVPGAVVLLRTPQGEFTATYGTTRWAPRPRPAPTPTSGSPRIPRR